MTIAIVQAQSPVIVSVGNVAPIPDPLALADLAVGGDITVGGVTTISSDGSAHFAGDVLAQDFAASGTVSANAVNFDTAVFGDNLSNGAGNLSLDAGGDISAVSVATSASFNLQDGNGGQVATDGNGTVSIDGSTVFVGSDSSTIIIGGASASVLAISVGGTLDVGIPASTWTTNINGHPAMPNLPTTDPANAGQLWNDGAVQVSGTTKSANTIFSGPSSGSAAAPTFRSLVSADVPSLDASKITTGTLGTARLGGGTASSTNYLRGDQTWATVTVPTAANPTASVGTTAVNGTATTFLRSDAAPAISQSITPTWTGLHTFNGSAVVKQVNGGGVGLTVKRFIGNSTDLLTCFDSDLAATPLFRVTPTSVTAMGNAFTINSDGSFSCSAFNFSVSGAGGLQANDDIIGNAGLQISANANITGSITTDGSITAGSGYMLSNAFTDPDGQDGIFFVGTTSGGAPASTILQGVVIKLQGPGGASLPTTDPGDTGALWVDTGGVLKVSGY